VIASRPPGPRGPALCHLPSHRRLHVVLEGETHDPAGAHNDQSCASGGHSPAILRSSRSADPAREQRPAIVTQRERGSGSQAARSPTPSPPRSATVDRPLCTEHPVQAPGDTTCYARLAARKHVVRVCQCCLMGLDGIAIKLVDGSNSESAVRFLTDWSVTVGEPWRRRGICDAADGCGRAPSRDRGIATLGITVGLFDAYGLAQRMYGRRGHIPDGRGACQNLPVPFWTARM
jgi:hypothetical protein